MSLNTISRAFVAAQQHVDSNQENSSSPSFDVEVALASATQYDSGWDVLYKFVEFLGLAKLFGVSQHTSQEKEKEIRTVLGDIYGHLEKGKEGPLQTGNSGMVCNGFYSVNRDGEEISISDDNKKQTVVLFKNKDQTDAFKSAWEIFNSKFPSQQENKPASKLPLQNSPIVVDGRALPQGGSSQGQKKEGWKAVCYPPLLG